MEKKIHLEVMRIVAILLVVYNHTGAFGYRAYTRVKEAPLIACYFFMAVLCKVAVPLMFMISGSVLLGKEESVKRLYGKRIFRIIVVLIVSSLLQSLYLNHSIGLLSFLKTIYQGPIITPYWFLYMYLSFLIVLPFLRSIIKGIQMETYKYLLVLWFAFSVVIVIINDQIGNSLNGNLHCFLVTDMAIFYPLIGYYFDRIYINDKKRLLYINLIGVLFIMLTGYFTWKEVILTGDLATEKWMNSFIAVPTVAVFLDIKYLIEHIKISSKLESVILIWGGAVFGIYLLEEKLRLLFLSKIITFLEPYIKTMPACLLAVISIVILGAFIVIILKKIPIIKKFL